MIKNNIFRRLALLVSLIMFLTSTVNTTFGFIITKTDSMINTFVPFDSIINNVLISKDIEHPFGDEYVIPDNIAFEFKVDFGSLYAKTTIKTTIGNIVADENGSINVSIKPGNPFSAAGIDAGTKVTVTEIQKDGSGFTVKDGKAIMEGIVVEDGSLNFRYINIYTPKSVSPKNVFVSGNKNLEGRDWQAGDSFSFKLEQKQNDNTWITLDTETIEYNTEDRTFNRFDFSSIVQALNFERVGVYDFRITEVEGDLENVEYDKSISTFSIHVTDVDMDGGLEINAVTAGDNVKINEADGRFNVELTFNNTFVPVIPDDQQIAVNIGVNKTVLNTGSHSIGPEGFKFMLENTVSGEKLTVKTDDNGDAVFSLCFDSSDAGKIYSYRLSEINGGISGVTYDTKVHDISIAVVLDEDNKLIANVVMNGNAAENPIAEFTNTYHGKISEPPPTGDNNIKLWIIIMMISGAFYIFLAIIERHIVSQRINIYKKDNMSKF